ncbi:collagen binding domain-containing protein [Lysinibacillus sp. LZ02]|uniref:collagen binding domain-containing protein n=1 Tax=Lysinibacillus sp. LZ02 TaxID=3420668 RepID=UPI003D364259
MRKLNIALLTVLVLFQTILGPFGTYGVTFAAEEKNTQNTSATAITPLAGLNLEFAYLDYNGTKISSTADANNVKPQAGDTVKLRYEFSTDEDLEFEYGDEFKFQLPDSFLVFDKQALSGPISIGSEKYFEYEVDENKVVTVKAVKPFIEGGIKGGYIQFSAKFGNFKTDDLEQTLDIPKYGSEENISIQLKFSPKGGDSSISKEGVEISGKDSAKRYIQWTVWVNQSAKEVTQFQFEDSWGEGDLSLDASSVKIESVEMEATLNEIKVVGTPTPVTTPNINQSNKGFDFTLDNLSGTNAYKVTYITQVERTPKSEVESFTNKVSVIPTISSGTENWDAEATVNLEYGKPLEKTYTGDKYKADWTVSYNYIGNQIKDRVLKDSLGSGSLHKYVEDSIRLYEIQGENEVLIYSSNSADNLQTTEMADVALNDTDKFIQVTFKKETTKPYKLKYETVSEKDIIAGENGQLPKPIANTVEVKNPGNPGEAYEYKVSTEIYAGYGVGRKDVNAVDYSNKEVEWKVELNADLNTMENVVIKDFLDTQSTNKGNLELLKYADGNYFRSETGTDPNSLSDSIIDKNGFTLKVGTLTDKMVFYYKTKFDVLEKYLAATGQSAYQNNIKFEWGGGESTQPVEDESKVGTFTPLEAFKNNAIKSGSYDYSTREFVWSLKANVNQNEINKIVDTLDDYQSFLGTSAIEIYKINVQPNGSLQRGEKVTSGYTPAISGQSLTLTFDSSTSSAYEIVYKTKDTDGIIGTGGTGNNKTNQTYKNNAEIYLNGELKGKPKEAEVTVEVADNLIEKIGTPNSADSTVDWKIDINKSGSTIKNIIVKDNLSSTDPNVKQFYLQESFELRPFVYGKDGVTLGSPVSLTDKGALTILPDKQSFEFRLNEENASYQLSYKSFYEGPNNGALSNNAVLNYTNSTTGQDVTGESTKSEVATNFTYNDSDAGMEFKRVNLEITKQGINNDDTSKNHPLKDVEFTVWNKSGKYQINDTVYKTDATGKFTIADIGTGTYVIKEKLPEGYVAPTTLQGASNIEVVTENGAKYAKYTVTIGKLTDGAANTKVWTVNNDEVLQSSSLKKTGLDSTKLGQVKFKLYKQDGTQVTSVPKYKYENGVRTQDGTLDITTLTPNPTTGEIYVSYLEPGSYYFQEIETAIGYKLDTTKKSFTISSNSIVKFDAGTLQNNPRHLTVENKGDDGEPLVGSTFDIYKIVDGGSCPNPTDGKVTDLTDATKYEKVTSVPVVTGEGGKVTVDISSLPSGQYFIVQNNITNVYYINRPGEVVKIDTTNCFTSSPTDENDVIPPVFENPRDESGTLVDLTLTKTLVDGDKHTIEGAVIKLTGKKANSPKIYYGKTDINGQITKWYKSEADAKEGDIAKAELTIIQDKYTVTELYNTGFKYEGLAKLDGANGFTNDSGIVFDYNKTTAVTDIKVTNKKLERTVIITNSCNKEETTYQLVNTTTNQVIKQDALGNNIPNIDPTTGVIKLPAGQAKIELTNIHLASGKYTVEQLTSSGGCKLSEDPKEITVVPDTPGNLEFPENDEPIKTTVTNEDPDGNKLVGSEFELYKAINGCPTGSTIKPGPGIYELVDTFTTGSDGKTPEIDFSEYGSGTYVVVQKSLTSDNKEYYVERAYELVEFDTSTCIEIEPGIPTSPGTQVPPATFENERGKGKITITKVDENEATKGIEGAEITITGTKIQPYQSYKGTSNVNGEIKFKDVNGVEVDVLFDDYVITETKFPTGYEGLKTTFTTNTFAFKESTKSTNASIQITNKKIERTVTINDSCTLGDRVYGIYAPDGTTEVGRVTLASGESTQNITLQFNLPDGQNTADFVVKQISSTNVECENPSEPTFPVTRDENPTPPKEVELGSNLVELTFENCYGPVSGTFTFSDSTNVYTVTVAEADNGKVTRNIPAGTYKVTGEGMVERTITITDDTANNKYTIATQDCGTIEIDFKSCEKDNTDVTTVDIYKKGETTPFKTVGTVNGVTNWTTTLQVGDYIAYPGGTTENGVEFSVTDGSNDPVVVNEPCAAEAITIVFNACDKLGTTTVDIYNKDTKVKVTTVDVNSNWTTSLAEGNYVAYPGGTTSNGTDFTVGKQTIQNPITVTQPCGTEKITIEFDACEKAATPTTSIDVYETDASGNPTGTATVVTKDANKYTVDLDNGIYIAYPGGTTTNGTSFDVTNSTTQVITVTEPCPAEEVTIEFDRCDKEGRTTVDIYNRDTDGIVTTVDETTAWKVSLEVGNYIAYPGGIKEFGTPFDVTKTTTVNDVIKVLEPCNPVPVEITLIGCNKLGTTTVDIYEIDNNNELIPASKMTVTVQDGNVTKQLDEGRFVIVLSGTTAFDLSEIITIDETTVGPIPVTLTQDCKNATITFKSCDLPMGKTTFTFDDGKGNTFTTSTDENGIISTTVPPGIYTVTNTTTNVSKVIDITSTVTNLVIVECEACIANVTVPELAGQTVTISDGSIIETVPVDATGTFTVPFTDGNLTVKDATGMEVGKITVTDCTGIFNYPACERPTITLPTYENKEVFILSETAVGGPITSPDVTTVDVALVVTSEDTATVDIDGKLTIDKSKLVDSNEYYIVDEFGKILKIIKLDGGDIVVFTPNRMEEVRLEECVPKNPIPFEPVPPTNPGGGTDPSEPTDPGTPPTDPSEPTDPGTPPTDPSEPTDPGTPPTDPSEPTDPGTPPTDPSEPTDPGTPPTDPSEPTDPGTPPTDPSEPTDPGTPPTDPSEPTDPGTPPTDPSEPTDPGTPPTDPSEPTDPGTPTPVTPEQVENIQKIIEDPIPNNPEDIKKQIEELKQFLEMFEQLTPEEQAELLRVLGVELTKLQERLAELERTLVAMESKEPATDGTTAGNDNVSTAGESVAKLPQTDGASTTAMLYAGLALMAMSAFFLIRRRKNA